MFCLRFEDLSGLEEASFEDNACIKDLLSFAGDDYEAFIDIYVTVRYLYLWLVNISHTAEACRSGTPRSRVRFSMGPTWIMAEIIPK